MEHHNYEEHLVRRDDVLNQLLQLYKDGLVDISKIAFLRFEGEEGTGDSVTCDVFSSFWDEFYSKFCEGSGQCVPCLTVQLSADDFKALGMIITHTYYYCSLAFRCFQYALAKRCFNTVCSEQFQMNASLLLFSICFPHTVVMFFKGA